MENEKQAEQPQAKSAEQIASENSLNIAIDDNTQEQQAEQQQQEQGVNDAEAALGGMLSLLPIGLSIAGLPKTAAVWNEGVCKGIAKAAIPVLQKYTWGQRVITFLQTGGGIEEYALLMVLAPVMITSYSAYQADTAIVEKEVEAAGGENEPSNQ